MKFSIRVIIILLMCFVFNACSQTAMQTDVGAGADPMLDSGVGTVVNNPGDNQLQIALEGGLVPEKSDFMIAEMSLNLKELLKIKKYTENDDHRVSSMHLILAGESLKSAMQEDRLFRTFGRLVKQGLDDMGIGVVTEELVAVNIPKGASKENALIVDLLNETEVVIDPFDSTYVRFYLKDIKNNKYHGTYLVKFEEGRPIKGLFAYVNPLFMAKGKEAEGKGLTAMAFDLSGSTVKYLVHKEDYSHKLGFQVVTKDYFECDLPTETCISEHLDINTEAPERLFGGGVMRYSWSGTHPNLCVAPTTYEGDARTMLSPKMLNEESLPPALEDCDLLMTPFWDVHIFTTDDLFMRSSDEKPSADGYYLDGTTLEGWHKLKPTTINEWLSF
ncbi:MAG: hypothetical protein ABII18_01550 [bacterium]